MRNLKLYLVVLAVLLLGALDAISLDEFYEAVYNADSVAVGPEFIKFLPEAQSVEDIDDALQMWMSYDDATCREWINKAYKKNKRDRNLGIARILVETDYKEAKRLAKKLIILNRKEPMAYQALVMNIFYDLAPMLNAEDWNYYKPDLIKEASYLKRYYSLAPEDDWALLGKLALDIAQERIDDAKQTVYNMAEFNIPLNRIFSLVDLAGDPVWREVMTYYVSLIPWHMDTNGDPEAMLDAASALSGYWYDNEEWSLIIDTFANVPETMDLGDVFINILIAYDKLGRNQEGLDLMASFSDGAAAEIITWWRTNYPDKGLEDYIDNLMQEFNGNPVADAAYLGSLSDPMELLNAGRNYCSAYPSALLGYKTLFSSWGEYFAKELYSNDEDDISSSIFREDLLLWDDYNLLNAEEALGSIQGMLERIYYGEKLINNTLIYTLRPQWIEASGIQFLSVNTFFNLEDYGSVIRMLRFMLDENTITAADLEQLATDENPVCTHQDWQSLLDYARSLAPVNPEDNE